MIAADLPPSSSVHALSLSAAILATSLPTTELPVKVYLSISGLAVSARPVPGPPGTIDSTPSGRPASANISAIANTESGVSAAGLSTTVQPATSSPVAGERTSMTSDDDGSTHLPPMNSWSHSVLKVTLCVMAPPYLGNIKTRTCFNQEAPSGTGPAPDCSP